LDPLPSEAPPAAPPVLGDGAAPAPPLVLGDEAAPDEAPPPDEAAPPLVPPALLEPDFSPA
jgi:hypothetical protein